MSELIKPNTHKLLYFVCCYKKIVSRDSEELEMSIEHKISKQDFLDWILMVIVENMLIPKLWKGKGIIKLND